MSKKVKIRLLHDWVLVSCEKPEEQKNGIVLVRTDRVAYGEVLQIGPGLYGKSAHKRTAIDLKVGERVAFFREHGEHLQGKQLKGILYEMGDNLLLLRAPDVLVVVGRETKVTEL